MTKKSNTPESNGFDRAAYLREYMRSHRTRRRAFAGQGGPTENRPPIAPMLEMKTSDPHAHRREAIRAVLADAAGEEAAWGEQEESAVT
jgi:hypothetical protein